MVSLINTSVALETTNFAANAETYTTLPFITPDLNPETELADNINLPIFSDDDISLPSVIDLKEFPETENPSLPPLGGFLNYDYDSFSFDEPAPAPAPAPVVENTNPKPTSPPANDFLNYDFDTFNFDDQPSNTADGANVNSTEASVGDFVNYDFDNLNFENSTNEDTGNDSLDLFSFQDYNFDLYDDPKEVVEEIKEYDINDGWLDTDYEYVEKTSEEKRKEMEDFDEEWSSIVQPPVVRYKTEYIIDLNPWLIWGPPILCLVSLFMLFVPCICLSVRDDKREEVGKPRKYGLPKIVRNLRREMYQKTSTGDWKKIATEKLVCTVIESSTSFNNPSFPAVHAAKSSVENVSYTKENETKCKTAVKDKSSAIAVIDKISKKSEDKDIPDVVVIKDVDLGDGSEIAASATTGSVGGSDVKKVLPGTSGDANWSMY